MGEVMPYEKTAIPGLYLFKPWLHFDERGSFHEAFNFDVTQKETGIDFKTMQHNVSVSNKGALRGIHFKEDPPGQRKIVRVEHGAIYDVVVDLRRSSPTFGKWLGFELNSSNHQSLLIGNGLGHGFLALESSTVVSYLCDTHYDPDSEHTISPLSFAIGWEAIAERWAIGEIRISERDRLAPLFSKESPLLFP